jgi:hypothetical protein
MPTTIAQTNATSPETTATQPLQPTSGGLLMEAIVCAVIVKITIAAAAIYVLRRKKPPK